MKDTLLERADSYLTSFNEEEAGETRFIKKRGDKWVLLQKGTGKVLGTHDNREGALKQLRAIQWGKHH